MGVIKKEDIDKAADEDVEGLSGDCSKFDARDAFKHGVEFAESKFEELAIQLGRWLKEPKNLDNKFPNGFTSWYETFYEIVESFSYAVDNIETKLDKLEGRGSLYEFAKELTDKFENIHKDKEWDGEFYDEIELFIKKELYE